MIVISAHCPESQVTMEPAPVPQWLAHTSPHVPQLVTSKDVLVQTFPFGPGHTMLGGRHRQEQVPLTQVGVKPGPHWHALPQPPQLPGSVMVSVQTSLQQVLGLLQLAAVHAHAQLTHTHRP